MIKKRCYWAPIDQLAIIINIIINRWLMTIINKTKVFSCEHRKHSTVNDDDDGQCQCYVCLDWRPTDRTNEKTNSVNSTKSVNLTIIQLLFVFFFFLFNPGVIIISELFFSLFILSHLSLSMESFLLSIAKQLFSSSFRTKKKRFAWLL